MSGDPERVTPGELVPSWVKPIAVAGFAVIVAGGALPGYPGAPAAAVAALVAVVAAAALVYVARLPLLAAAVATVAIAVEGDARSSDIGWLAACLLAGWCVIVISQRVGLIYWAAIMILFAVEWLWIRPDPGWGAWLAGSTLTVLFGLMIRHQIDLNTQLRAAQAGLAARARTQERNRIARELHDVIGHTLVVSLLHVQSARLAVEHDPADAARAEQFRSAGADVTLAVQGDTGGLPATTGLAVYRIAQEALTNAVKHAPGRPTAVQLSVGAGRVTLIADSRAEPGSVARPGTGLGVVSMRERAESLGGTCEAGPGGQGWLVRATLPLDASLRAAP